MKQICVIADGYPSEHFVVNAFVETLVNEMTDQGVECCVIAPQSRTNALVHKRKLLPYKRIRKTGKGNPVTVYTPKYVSVSAKKWGPVNTTEIGLLSFRHAAEQVFEKLVKEHDFDAVYGHFIYPAGITANDLGQKYGIPAFFAYGENTTYTIDYLGDQKTRTLLQGVTGVISVSSENKRVLVEKRMVPESRIGVFPNSVDTGCFYPRDREQARQTLGFEQDAFIVAFVGRFLDVKGPDRLSAAIEKLGDDGIASVFIGDGPLRPSCRNILHCAPLQHDEIPMYLSAADVFVLPTKAEGCCNAIVEAMACGLPVISSALPFNDDILDADRAILLDPTDIDAIAAAIRQVKADSAKRSEMAAAALRAARHMSIDERARRILQFMDSLCLQTGP